MQRWVADLRSGRRVEAAGRRLFEHYYPWVRGFFRRRGHAVEDAEELAQEVFLQVFEQIATLRDESSFKSWLFAVAANVLRNDRRRQRRLMRSAPEVPLDAPAEGAGETALAEPAAETPSPARTAFSRQRGRALAEAVAALPTRRRQCLLLRVDQGLKYRQIAALLGLSIQTVKVHLHHARRDLAEALGERLAEWED